MTLNRIPEEGQEALLLYAPLYRTCRACVVYECIVSRANEHHLNGQTHITQQKIRLNSFGSEDDTHTVYYW